MYAGVVSGEIAGRNSINILLPLVALLLRPHIAVGYLVSLAGLIAGSLLYTVSCLATCALFASAGPGVDVDAEGFFTVFCPAVFWLAWLGLGVWGSVWFYRRACGRPAQETLDSPAS